MNKAIIPIIMLLVSCSFLVSGLYSGDSMTFETNITNPIYTVSGNSSNLDGLNVYYNNGNITIETDPRFKPDNFTLIFMNKEKEIVEKHHYSSGRTNTITKYENNTEVITEYEEVPFCNNSCCSQGKEKIEETEEKGFFEKNWRVLVLSTIILFLIIYNIRKEKSTKKTQEKEIELKGGSSKDEIQYK